ncbi:hypothetical protein P154DRAFT_583033 [Amniculicola lignicola CBS 123094]|uniref:Uncharacterized protein n=1 Tax=Amniculicola lignicola CBS 123094 TaxID=1392246 RepID=A0A6A5VX06_9PLEO|nr:hypothetical protein P154DRAFT_583033 [Amniculicola lignicola CBS 123094]
MAVKGWPQLATQPARHLQHLYSWAFLWAAATRTRPSGQRAVPGPVQADRDVPASSPLPITPQRERRPPPVTLAVARRRHPYLHAQIRSQGHPGPGGIKNSPAGTIGPSSSNRRPIRACNHRQTHASLTGDSRPSFLDGWPWLNMSPAYTRAEPDHHQRLFPIPQHRGLHHGATEAAAIGSACGLLRCRWLRLSSSPKNFLSRRPVYPGSMPLPGDSRADQDVPMLIAGPKTCAGYES